MATLPTVSEFKTLYPTFASIDDAIMSYRLESALCRVNPDVFGDCAADYKRAIYSYLAHISTLDSRGGGSAGPITAESVGSLSRSYGQTQSGNNLSLSSTAYGMEYLSIVRLYGAGGTVIC